MADQLVREKPKLEDPIPQTLEAIRSETAYWTNDLTTCDPGSNWWEWVQARLAELRQTEQRLSSDRAVYRYQQSKQISSEPMPGLI